MLWCVMPSAGVADEVGAIETKLMMQNIYRVWPTLLLYLSLTNPLLVPSSLTTTAALLVPRGLSAVNRMIWASAASSLSSNLFVFLFSSSVTWIILSMTWSLLLGDELASGTASMSPSPPPHYFSALAITSFHLVRFLIPFFITATPPIFFVEAPLQQLVHCDVSHFMESPHSPSLHTCIASAIIPHDCHCFVALCSQRTISLRETPHCSSCSFSFILDLAWRVSFPFLSQTYSVSFSLQRAARV